MTLPLNAQVLVDAAKKLQELDSEAKKATSALNKQKTAFKNSFLEYRRTEGLDASSMVQIGDVEYAYAPAVHEQVDPRSWFALYKANEITEEQYFAALSVSITEARESAGVDHVLAITKIVAGKTFDIRAKKTDDSVAFRVNQPMKATAAPRKRTSAEISATRTATPVRIRRTVKVGG